MAARKREVDGSFVAREHSSPVSAWGLKGWPPKVFSELAEKKLGVEADAFGVAFWWASDIGHDCSLIYASFREVERLHRHRMSAFGRAVREAQKQAPADVLDKPQTVLDAHVLLKVFDAGAQYQPPRRPRGRPSEEGQLRDAQRVCMVQFLASRAGLPESRGGESPGPYRTACDAVALGEWAREKTLPLLREDDRLPIIMRGLMAFTPGLSAWEGIVEKAEEEARKVIKVVDTPDEMKQFHEGLSSLERHQPKSMNPVRAAGTIRNVWYRYRRFLPGL